MLNTIETDGTNNTNHINRCRYSINGSPFAQRSSGGNDAPFAWLETNQTHTVGGATAVGSGAGFLDAPIEEQIVSAEFIKDRLIVYFERSTFELVYTGNEVRPFQWQKLNTELGAEATFSTVAFDKSILAVGNSGIHACNGANVERIDNKIPDEVFEIVDKAEGPKRVAGIRDYFTEMVYWTFPSTENTDKVFPDKVIVFNYATGSWALNDDALTSFGYFEQQTDRTWQDMVWQWQEDNSTWASGVQHAQFRQIIAGNAQGFIFIIDPRANTNASNMPITNIENDTSGVKLTIVDNNLKVGDFITVDNAQGVTFSIDGPIYEVVEATTSSVVIDNLESDTPIILTITGTYTGGATAARVSQIDILSKPWNPYVQQGRNVYLAKIDFGVQRTTNGEITVDYFPSYTNFSILANSTPSLMGTGVLETKPYSATFAPLEQQQDQLWHPLYFQVDGQAVQIRIYLDETQMYTTATAFSYFELHGLVLHTMPASSRLQ